MKTVTLFKVTTETIQVDNYQDIIQVHHVPFEAVQRVMGAGDEVAFMQDRSILSIPIRKHMRRTELSHEYLEMCGVRAGDPNEGFSTEETYIAIHPAAEKVLNIETSRMESLEDNLTNLRKIIKLTAEQTLKIERAGLFTRIKWLFTGVKIN